MSEQNVFTFMRSTKDRLTRLETKQGRKTIVSEAQIIVSDTLTVAYREFYRVAAETGTADDIVTINGGEDGYFLTLVTETSGQTITLKTGTGNLRLNGDCALTATDQSITLRYSQTIAKWVEIARKLTSGGGGGGSPADALLSDGSVPLQGNLSVDAGITIDGIDIGAPGAGLGVSGIHLVVDQNYGFVWTAQHDFQAGLKATTVGATASLTVNPTNDLILYPGNKVFLQAGKEIRTTDWVSGFLGVGWGITNPSGNSLLDIRKIQVEELHAYVFVSDIERVRVGETFVTQSMGLLKGDMTTPSIGGTTTLTIEDIPQAAGAAFLNNEWVLMQLVDRSGGGINIARAWGQVSSYVDNSGAGEGTQSYTYTHRHGTVGLTFKEGSYVLDFGLSGDGYIHESVIDSAGSPYTRYATWAGDPSVGANRTVHVQIGNLDSVTDIDLNPNGWGLYADNVFLNGDFVTANGLVRILDGLGINLQVDNGPLNNSSLSIQWWPDITAMTGNATLAILAYTNPTAGPSLHANSAQIRVYPTGGNQADLLLYAYPVGGGQAAYIQLWGASSGALGGSQISLYADLMVLGNSGQTLRLDTTLTTQNLLSKTASTYNIGSAGNPYHQIYADEIIASSFSGGPALSGQVWQYDIGDMFIRSSSSGLRVLHIANPGAGAMSLDVELDITLGGLIDGVDLSAFRIDYTTHIADHNAHHNQSHILASTAVLGADHTVSGLTAGMVLKATGPTTALFVALNHSELTGLTTGDPHTQYVSVATARNITAVHTFSPGSAGPPFSLGVNAVGQTVIGLKADQLNKTITAGTGLSGGGTLTGNVTLAISFGAPTVALSVASTNAGGVSNNTARADHSHQILSSNSPGVAASLLASDTLGRLTLQSLTLNAGSGVGLTMPSSVISSNDGFDGTHKFGQTWIGSTDRLTFMFLAQRDNATLTNYFAMQGIDGASYLNAADTKAIYFLINNVDVMSMEATNLSPFRNYKIDLGSFLGKWRTIFASELYVENLVAQDVMATIGGRITVAPTTQLIDYFPDDSATMFVKHNNMQVGDYINMTGISFGLPQIEFMQVTAGPVTETDGYSYTVNRDLDGTGSNNWDDGSAVISLGHAVGQGWIDLTSTSTILNHFGPVMVIYNRTGIASWDQVVPTVAVGNLDGFVDYASPVFGWAVGNDLTLTPVTGFSGMTGDAVDGLRLFNVIQRFFTAAVETLHIAPDTGISFTNPAASPSNYSSITWYKGALGVGRMSYMSTYTVSGNNRLGLFVEQASGGTSQISLVANNALTDAVAEINMQAQKSSMGILGQMMLQAQYLYFLPLNSPGTGVALDGHGISIGALPTNGEYVTDFTFTGNSLHLTLNFQGHPNQFMSEISNDITTFNALMLVGNSRHDLVNRKVSVYDWLGVGIIPTSALHVIGNGLLTGSLTAASGAFASGLTAGATTITGNTGITGNLTVSGTFKNAGNAIIGVAGGVGTVTGLVAQHSVTDGNIGYGNIRMGLVGTAPRLIFEPASAQVFGIEVSSAKMRFGIPGNISCMTLDSLGVVTVARTIATQLGFAWDFGTYTAGVVTALGSVTIKIGGIQYRLLAA